MARNANTFTAASGLSDIATNRESAEATYDGIALAREWVGASLATARRAADWMERLQAINTQTAATWTETLKTGAREVEQAAGPQSLWAVPPQILNRQLELMSRQFAAALEDLLHVQAKWADDWRSELAGHTQRLMRHEVLAGPGLPPATQAALGQYQEQWLRMTRAWIDVLGSATRQSRPA